MKCSSFNSAATLHANDFTSSYPPPSQTGLLGPFTHLLTFIMSLLLLLQLSLMSLRSLLFCRQFSCCLCQLFCYCRLLPSCYRCSCGSCGGPGGCYGGSCGCRCRCRCCCCYSHCRCRCGTYCEAVALNLVPALSLGWPDHRECSRDSGLVSPEDKLDQMREACSNILE